MTTLYVRSTDGNNADDGLTWATAKATIAGAFSAAAAGDIIYVSDNHAETQGTSISLNSPGTSALPCLVLCVDDAAEPPTAFATTATVTATGGGMAFTGSMVAYGITFSSAANGPTTWVSTSAWFQSFVHCKHRLTNSGGTSAYFSIGADSAAASAQLFEMIESDFYMAHVNQNLTLRCNFKWLGGSLLNLSPSSVFNGDNGPGPVVTVRGVDLSLAGSGKNLVASTAMYGRYLLENCKITEAVTKYAAATNVGAGIAQFIRCGASAVNHGYYFAAPGRGEVFSETTIVRTGGATDGTTPVARKIVSGSATQYLSPCSTEEQIVGFAAGGAAVNATIHLVTDGVTLTDKDIWATVEHLGDSGSPKSTIQDSSPGYFASATNHASDSATAWTTTGLSSPTKQKIDVSFTPQIKGPYLIRLHVAKASTTIYYCPKVDVA